MALMDNQIENILKEHHLKVTQSRKDVLGVFYNIKFAVSHSFLEEQLKNTNDRVTIYRTLYTFLDKGIIHKVLDEGGTNKYALCSTCDTHSHSHDHVHFKCQVCLETNCIEDILIPNIRLPEGYLSKETGILIQGICKKCNV